jgi:hypothetical protein
LVVRERVGDRKVQAPPPVDRKVLVIASRTIACANRYRSPAGPTL